MTRWATSRFQMNRTISAPTVAPISPAPWSSRYQPMVCPMKVATNAPAIPSAVVSTKPVGLFSPADRSRAMRPATNPITTIQMILDIILSLAAHLRVWSPTSDVGASSTVLIQLATHHLILLFLAAPDNSASAAFAAHAAGASFFALGNSAVERHAGAPVFGGVSLPMVAQAWGNDRGHSRGDACAKSLTVSSGL